jgi:hypothetical protein
MTPENLNLTETPTTHKSNAFNLTINNAMTTENCEDILETAFALLNLLVDKEEKDIVSTTPFDFETFSRSEPKVINGTPITTYESWDILPDVDVTLFTQQSATFTCFPRLPIEFATTDLGAHLPATRSLSSTPTRSIHLPALHQTSKWSSSTDHSSGQQRSPAVCSPALFDHTNGL